AVALVGCGSSASPDQPTNTTTPTATAPHEIIPEPTGKLSPAEYANALAAYKQISKIRGVKNLSRAIKLGAPACDKFATQTALIVTIRSSCIQAFRVFRNIDQLKKQTPVCTRDARAGDISCFSTLFRSIGRSARVSGIRDRAVNVQLRKRK